MKKENIRIKHVYGNLDYNSSITGIPNCVDQKNKPNVQKWLIDIFNSNIKTLRREDFINSPYLYELNNCERIIFLGYGFAPYNNRVLFENRDNFLRAIENKQIFSTGKMDENFVNAINEFSPNDNYKPILQNEDCLQILQRLYPIPLFPNEI